MIQFSKTDGSDFYSILRSRVKSYFQSGNISQYGGIQLIFKTVCLLSLLFIPYGLILSGYFSLTTMLTLAGVMGVAIAMLGMAVMHDANHGTYSSNDTLTRIIGFYIYALIIGGNPTTWRIQHNILHHRFTNIYGKDEDLEPYGSMRLTPNAAHKPAYRYQHLYSFMLYGILTLMWVLHKEFLQLTRYRKLGLIKSNSNYYKQMAILIASKAFYFGYLLVIPMLVLNITFMQWLIAFLFFHFISGIIISTIFQMAHVVNEAKFPLLNNEGNIDNQWAIHQIQTTTNFSPKSRIMYWFIGGLNYQIEHHLFPGVSHIHYKKIASIVQKTAKEFGIPYNSHKTFFAALKSHIYFMKTIGQSA